MGLQVSYSICAQIQKKSILRRKEIGNRRNNKTIMSVEGSRYNRGRGVSRPHPYAGKYPAQNERIGIYGIFKREKCTIDISEMG